jgi:hypothetical protein
MTAQTQIQPNGPGTSFSGPVISGPRNAANAQFNGDNQGIALLTQVVQLTQNGTNAVTFTAYVPKHSQLVDFIADTTIAWNSATSALMSIGTTAGDTTYCASTSIATGGRLRPTLGTTQLAAMLDTGSVEPVVFTVTPTGATSAGTTFVTMMYIQTQNYQNP